MTPAIHKYHRHGLHAHSNAHPDHHINVNAQHEQTIYKLECMEFCVMDVQHK